MARLLASFGWLCFGGPRRVPARLSAPLSSDHLTALAVGARHDRAPLHPNPWGLFIQSWAGKRDEDADRRGVACRAPRISRGTSAAGLDDRNRARPLFSWRKARRQRRAAPPFEIDGGERCLA